MFKKIYIEITNVCNLKCSFCPKTTRPPDYMTVERFRYIINEIKGLTQNIYLHVKGEPFMHPEIEKLIDAASVNNFTVNITTNGTLLDGKSDFIFQSSNIRQINISLHSHSDAEIIHNFDNYISGIMEFLKNAEKLKRPYISLRLWNLSEKISTSSQMAENKEILNKIENHFKFKNKLDVKISKKSFIKITENIFVNFQTRFEWPNIEGNSERKNGFCLGMTDHIAILVDGSVIPCCLDGNGDAVLGNIFSEKLSDILQKPEALNIKEGFSKEQAKIPLCQKCTYKDRFM